MHQIHTVQSVCSIVYKYRTSDQLALTVGSLGPLRNKTPGRCERDSFREPEKVGRAFTVMCVWMKRGKEGR